MADEIELKLALPEAAHRRFLSQPLLREAIARRRMALVNVYYDTPDLALHGKGIALRLRRQGDVWLQTVKCAGEGAGGLTARPEWETPYQGHFDFAAVDDEAVRHWLERPRIRARLAPVFETNFRRVAWRFPGLELVLDRGWIAAAGRREAISELELELVGGELTDLFALAGRFAERLPLAPALLSKAERGYRLYQGQAMAPQKAGEVPLAAVLPPLTSFRAIAADCLAQMQANHAGVTSSDDPEYLHQMRIGTRRLRACLRLFAPLLPADAVATLLPPLREFMALLGRARDLDVLLAEIAAPVLAALPDEPRLAALAGIITDRRHRARADVVHALLAPRYGQLMLKIAALLHEPAPVAAEAEAAATIGEFSAGRLRRLRRRVRRLARAAAPDDPVALHALRIGVKRLRYALEFFAGLGGGRADGHRRRRLATRLAQIQDTLGQMNDLANAGRLLAGCAGDDGRLREAVTLIGGWHGPRYAQLLARLPGLLARMRRLPPLT